MNQILTDASNAGASDIHIEGHGEERKTVVRFREHGSCYSQFQVPPRNRLDTISRIKVLAQLNISYDNAFQPVRGKGYHACHQTGYKGRVGIHELLVATDDIKSLIHARAPVAELLNIARSQGVTTLMQDGIRKCIQG